MKKLFAFALFTFTAILSAQDVILQEKIDKNNFPMRSWFIDHSNNIAIANGYLVGQLTKINEITLLSPEGVTKILNDGKSYMNVEYSNFGRRFYLENYRNKWRGDNYYFLKTNGDLELKGITKRPKNSLTRSFESDNFYVYLNPYTDNEIKQLKKENKEIHRRYKISYKKNSTEFDFSSEIKSISEMGEFAFENNSNLIDNFYHDGTCETIQKFIHNDCNKVKIFRVRYDLNDNQAKVVFNKEYLVDLENHNFVLAVTGGGGVNVYREDEDRNFDASYGFRNNASITNFKEDKDGNIYFYGLFGTNDKQSVKDNDIIGYFIQKFDKEGKLIWKRKYPFNFDEKKVKFILQRTLVNLDLINDVLTMSVCFDRKDSYVLYSDISITDGKIIDTKYSKFDLNIKVALKNVVAKEFLLEFYSLEELSSQYKFDANTLVYYLKNDRVKKYIQELTLKNKTHFNSFTSSEGFWLLQTDNQSYYKVLYFKF
jgi:hypothetical protein